MALDEVGAGAYCPDVLGCVNLVAAGWGTRSEGVETARGERVCGVEWLRFLAAWTAQPWAIGARPGGSYAMDCWSRLSDCCAPDARRL